MIQDSKMNELYKNDHLLGRFIGWARSKSEVLAQTGVYALGNLARSGACVIWHSFFSVALTQFACIDEICIDLVKRHHLHQALLEAFNLTDKATFRYAILGCLKHLCLASMYLSLYCWWGGGGLGICFDTIFLLEENRSIIGEANVIPTIATLLETTNDMLKRNQFLTIGIIKLLCANECGYLECLFRLSTAHTG